MSKFTPRIEEFWINILADGISKTRQRNLSVHDIPFSNRNLIQDTGAATNSYSFTVAFQDNPPLAPGQDLENRTFPTYESRLPFIQLLNSGESLIFQHPSEGILDVRVESWTETETSDINYMEISIELLQEIDEISARDIIYPIDENASSFRGATELTESKLTTLSSTITNLAFRSQIAQFTNELNTFFSDVDSLSNSIINTINYVEGTVGDLLLTINQSVDRMVQAQKDVAESPAIFINNLITQTRAMSGAFLDLAGQPTFESITTLTMGTARIAVEIAESLVEDDKNQEKALKNIGIETFDNKGNFIGEPEQIVTMTINELESTVQDFRQLVDDVMQLDRQNRELLDQARILQTYVDSIKLTREKIITVSVNNINLFDLLNRFGLSYQEGDKIHSLNPEQRNPNFYNGEVRLIVPSV